VYIELFPVRVKTLAAFSGLDPWNGLAPAEFTIEAHLLGPKNPVRAPRDTGGPYILGIRSELDGEMHMMPESLSELWQTGKAPAEALPGLLHGIEPRLSKQDFRFCLRAKWHIWILGFYSAVALAAWLWGASQLAAASRDVDARLLQDPRFLSGQEWLTSPMKAMQPVILVVPALEGSRTLSRPVRFPPGIVGGRAGQPDTLAWVKAVEGRRLVLINGAFARSIRAPQSAVLGFALRRSDLSLPESTLDELRASLPGLTTDLVMCLGWAAVPPDDAAVIFGIVGIVIGAIALAFGLLVFSVIRRRQLRRRRQMAEILAALGQGA